MIRGSKLILPLLKYYGYRQIVTIDEDIEVDISDCFQNAPEDSEDDRICYFYDGNEGRPLSKGENVVKEWSFKELIK